MISIVMAYYNRLPQLKYTLSTIRQSRIKDYEVVIVDDYSAKEHSILGINKLFPEINFQIISMHNLRATKNYVNPCIPYNIGFRKSKGNKIIIQNPECCHIGDVLAHVDNFLTNDNYLSFHCFALGKREVSKLHNEKKIDISNATGRWYNHQIHRPLSYHFTTAITRKNLIELNGFDEDYATGFNYDDAEFIERIRLKKLSIDFVENPYVIHQYHGKSLNNPLNPTPSQDNSELFSQSFKTLSIRAKNNKECIS